MRELLRDGYVLFILIVSMAVNTAVFLQEFIKPTSAEHWQVGLAFLFLASVTYLWNRVEKSEIKEFTMLILLVNGILAIILDLIAILLIP